jgi:diacylglycerol kinase family enzyme
MFIANPRAGSVSARTREVMLKSLEADFRVEDAVTQAREHASELARDAVDRGFEAVIAFGGDGTINEVAQGLVGTDVALGILPGGTTNVMARSLGMPTDPVEATSYLAHRLRSGTRRRINVGRADKRYFLFSVGMGLDATVVKRVEENPEGKRDHGEWLFLWNAVRAALGEYRGVEPMISMTVEGGDEERVVLAVTCNGRPFTYFKRFPVDVCPQASLNAGLDIFGLQKVTTQYVPRIAWAILVSRSHVGWKKGSYHHDVRSIDLVADRPLPVQVDGDYIGEWTSAEIRLLPDALDVLV